MAIEVFNATGDVQFSLRRDTGLHPGDLSLGVYCPPEYDAMDWKTAVALAKWILECDKVYADFKKK